jgi:LysM repeat protein/ABC-type branched-subunit amino acid transport system substrate-binding protein
LSFVFCLLLTFSASAQEKESTEIHKTRSSATISGVRYYLHTVEKGQTLFAIAKFYGTDVNDVVIDNPDAIDGIKPGQVLRIKMEKKAATVAVTDTSNCILYKIEKGQTLYSITKQYSVSAEKLRALNPELKDGLKVGQMLKIPSNKPKTESAVETEKTTPIPTTPATTTSTVDISKMEEADKTTISNYKGKFKSEYNIAFFLPFHADDVSVIDVDKIAKGDEQLPNKTTVALQFYEGALLAIDSLKKQKLNAKIFVYDIDDKDSLNIVNILKKPELGSMDLMIGPLYGYSFMPIAKFAKEHNIAIVSPFTQVNKILFNNPYVCKVSPSTTLQVEQMARFVIDTFQTENIILVNNSNVKESSFFNAFKNTANQALFKAGRSASDSVKIAYNLNAVQNMLSTTKTNVVVLPSNNQSYVTDFISKLNTMRDKYKIVLFGLQNWINYDNLDFEYLNNLTLHVPSNNFIDYQNSSTRCFMKNYREKYKTEPEMYSYQGFDETCYFVSSLQKYGTGFLKNVSENKFQGIGTDFNFSQFPSDSGFENKFVFILKYQDYKLVKAN